MNFVIERVNKALESFGIITIPDDEPNKLFVPFDLENLRYVMMIQNFNEAHLTTITTEVPVEFSVEKEDSAFLAAAYINRTLTTGSATYLPDINRIVFKFYMNMEEDNLNLGMFFYCYYEAIDLVRRFYPTVDLLEKGAVLPKDVVEMERNRI